MVAGIATSVGMARSHPVDWVSDLSLPPLFALLSTGLYLFALPYLVKRRDQTGTASESS